MASLKEIRGRINSISNTRKITSAMKMVSSAKLHKAQDNILRFHPYWRKINGIMDVYFENEMNVNSLGLFMDLRKVKKLVIVVFSSNSGLCGAFNVNIQKKMAETLNEYATLPKNNISIYFIGKKGYEGFAGKNLGYNIAGIIPELADKPDYEQLNKVTNKLINTFLSKNVDKVEFIYSKYKNTAIQHATNELLLPIVLEETSYKRKNISYIIEPDPQQLSKSLVPAVIRLKMYGALLNSYASEHGARTTAMQVATDNADELIENLKLQYNKLRQDAITKEIIDIVGGSEIFR